ncbi:glycosyltransferase family 2 protein [Candidatus Nomurabacteria bacterium]|nr:glycosyltransferase family 2 protein [Candidatus Nomurabacteria bacterium]
MSNSIKTPYLSICIPTYEMSGVGANFLRENFDIFLKQTFKNFNIIISDDSKDDSIKNICDEYKDILSIKYVKNTQEIGLCGNLNNAMKNADGEIIKILLMDDFLYNETSLQKIVDNFDIKNDYWLATACTHTKDGKTFTNTHYPKYNNYIHYGRNTIGTPSVITVKNENICLLNPTFNWSLNDCDYYKSNYDRFGKPKILDDINVVVRQHEHQITNTRNTISSQFKEFSYMLKKHNNTIFSHPEILMAYIKLHIKSILRIIKI